MSQKIVYIDGIGEVTLARRRGSKSLRLTVNAHGRVRVGMPYWVPYYEAIKFVKKRQVWITEQKVINQHAQLSTGIKIGKAHTLYIVQDIKLKKLTSRIDRINIRVTGPYPEDDQRTQHRARAACEKALLQEASNLLPQRLKSLAERYKFSYKDVRIKKLTSRWGSCSSQGIITLSYYLMQLPWNLIDYVILHELVHTKYLNHGTVFWNALEQVVPSAKNLQKAIKNHKPRVEPWTDLI